MTHNILANRGAARPSYVWSTIPQDSGLAEQLRSLCHTAKQLEKAGYITEALSERKIMEKLRCEKCKRIVQPPNYHKDHPKIPTEHAGVVSKDHVFLDDTPNRDINKPIKFDVCLYHPQGAVRGRYECCRTPIFTRGDQGCTQAETHHVHHNYTNIIRTNWQFHAASLMSNPRGPLFSSNRGDHDTTNFRTAITLDCEFGTNRYNQSELIRLSAIDFFTKETLLDSLVDPMTKLESYNTKYSGICKADMDNARARGEAISGRDAARERLLRFLGPDTIIITHGGSGDLVNLRLIHPWVVDTFIVDQIFWEPVAAGRGLKALCKQLCGIDVQTGNNGHDSKEDAFACREVLLAQMGMLPGDWEGQLEALREEERSEREMGSREKRFVREIAAREDAEAVAALRSHAEVLRGMRQMRLPRAVDPEEAEYLD